MPISFPSPNRAPRVRGARPAVIRYRLTGYYDQAELLGGYVGLVVRLTQKRFSWIGDAPTLRPGRVAWHDPRAGVEVVEGACDSTGDLWEALILLRLLAWISQTLPACDACIAAPSDYYFARKLAIESGHVNPMSVATKPEAFFRARGMTSGGEGWLDSSDRPLFSMVPATAYSNHPEVAELLRQSKEPSSISLVDAATSIFGTDTTSRSEGPQGTTRYPLE